MVTRPPGGPAGRRDVRVSLRLAPARNLRAPVGMGGAEAGTITLPDGMSGSARTLALDEGRTDGIVADYVTARPT